MLIVRHAVVGPFAENTYLVGDSESGEAVLIDPGGELDRVLALREPGSLRISAHLSHSRPHRPRRGLRRGAVDDRRCRCQIHRGDASWLAALSRQAEMFGFDAPGTPGDRGVTQDGETFAHRRQLATVLHTPGHTRGSCCLFFEQARVLFAGDTLFAGSVGRTDLPGGDFEELDAIESGKSSCTLGDDVRFYPGHGPSGLIGDERRTNPFVGEATRRRSL